MVIESDMYLLCMYPQRERERERKGDPKIMAGCSDSVRTTFKLEKGNLLHCQHVAFIIIT